MSGETEREPSGWTLDTLKAYYDTRLAEKDLRDQQRFEATERHLNTMNEFRGSLEDQSRKFIPRDEYVTAHEPLVKQIEDLGKTWESRHAEFRETITTRIVKIETDVATNTAANVARRGGASDVWAYIVAAAGVAFGIVGLIISSR